MTQTELGKIKKWRKNLFISMKNLLLKRLIGSLSDKNFSTISRHRTSSFHKDFTYNLIIFYNKLPTQFKECKFPFLKLIYKQYLLGIQ